jgi:hypothetical protein
MSSPEHTSGSIPTHLMQKFSAMVLRHTASRSPRQDSGMVSQAPSPVQVQTPAQAEMAVTAQDNESRAVDVLSEKPVAMLDDSSIPTLVLESPSDDETTTETHTHNKEESSEDVKILPEESNAIVDNEPKHKPETTPEKNGNSPTSEHGMSPTFHTRAQRLHWYRTLQVGLSRETMIAISKGVTGSRFHPSPLCFLIAMSRRLAKRRRSPPSAVSVLLATRQFNLSDLTSSNTDPKQPKPRMPPHLGPIPNFETVVKLFDEVLTANNINTGTVTDNFNRLLQDMQRFHQQRDDTAFKFQKCYSSHSRTKTSPANCVDCFLYVENIEHSYIQTCLKIKKVMEELSESIRGSFLKLGVHKEIPDQEHVDPAVLDEMMVYLVNMQRLVETEDMLRSLEEDAEAGLGWPQVSSSEGSPEDDQGPKTQPEETSADLVEQNEDTDDTKSSHHKSKKGKSKQQKKKRGKR